MIILGSNNMGTPRFGILTDSVQIGPVQPDVRIPDTASIRPPGGVKVARDPLDPGPAAKAAPAVGACRVTQGKKPLPGCTH
jgi:hypothetical protein